MNKRLVGLVASREINARLRDRAFWISTIFLIVIAAASVVIPSLIFDEDERPDVTLAATAGTADELARAAAAVAKASPDGSPAAATVTVVAAAGPGAAEDAVRTGTADAALVETDGALTLVGDRRVPGSVRQAVAAAHQQLALRSQLVEAGLSQSRADIVIGEAATATVVERLLDPPSDDEEAAIGLSVLFALAFFFTTFMFGMGISQSVVEEKQGRVVELLVAAVPVRSLLTGKVLGNLALAVGQILTLLVAGLIGSALAGQGDVARMLARSSGWFMVFFLLGFGMFACLWAAAGALASRQEDLQSTTVPLQALLFVPFFGAVYVSTPGTALTVLSYIPFTAPIAMPRRLLLDDAALWEPFVSAGIMLATAVAFVLVAARLYERSLLRTQSRVSWREAWSAPSR